MSSKDIKLGVSLYSYQEAIWRGDLDLSGALTAVKGCGATGVEIFGEALMPSFPYVSNEFLYEWNYWMDNLQLEPVCYEHFADRRFSPNPDEYLTDDDLFDMTLQYLRSAKKLGCSLIRLSHTGHNGKRSENFTPDPGRETINPETSERLLPYAQDLGGAMALELHAPGVLQDGGNDAFLEAIDRTGCYGGGGLMLDLSACFRDISPMLEDSYVAQGAKREIVQYMRKIDKKANTFDGNNQVDWDEVKKTILDMGGGEAELRLYERYQHGPLYARKISSPEVVEEYASKLIYVHGKMHWINDDCTSDEVDYPRVIRALAKGGYKGYISTEFEGQRSVPHTLNEIEFVRKQHILMRQCLADCAAEGL